MINTIKSALRKRLPIYQAYNSLLSELGFWKKGLYPPGHYYSPVVDDRVSGERLAIDYSAQVQGVDLNEQKQFEFLQTLAGYYRKDLFPVSKTDNFRYYYNNYYFSYSDGVFLSLMMQHFQPRLIIEVGSGFSSALMLDTNEKYMGRKAELVFIEPYPEERLAKLISKTDGATVRKQFVQDVPVQTFDALSAGDILFIDSSHVSKFRSDLNYLMFQILPRLKSGVIIHFHDIFFPFEYPIEWIRQGRSWNEAYLIHAFLQHNADYELLMFTSYMEGKHRQWFEKNMDICLTHHEYILLDGKNSLMATTGQSLYLRKK